jgi:precorrin-6A/cobalt-precorrin-6A reductase
MPANRILILGGTRMARDLAAALVRAGFDVITSLAGVTDQPVLPEGAVRRGGFGGTDGLVRYIQETGIAALVDATHPFAAQMSAHAGEAADRLGVPLLRLERPAWERQAGDRWTFVTSAEEAAASLPCGARAFVTIGRKEIGAFFARTDIRGVARMIEPRGLEVPDGWKVILQRPPFSLGDEMSLITHHAITHVVAKNAGGAETEAKLLAARQLGLPVILLARPSKPAVQSFMSVEDTVGALRIKLLP